MIRAIGFTVAVLIIGPKVLAQPAGDISQIPVDSAIARLTEIVVENPDGFHELALATLSRAYEAESPRLIADAHDLLASWHGYHRPYTYDSVLHHSQRTVAYLEKVDDPLRLAESYLTLAADYINVNQMDRGQELIFKAISIFETRSDGAGLSGAYRRLATMYNQEDQTDLAIRYGELALETARENEVLPTQAMALMELTEAYRKSDQFDKAYRAADECIRIAEEELPQPDYIGVVLRAYGYRGAVAQDAGEFDRAITDHTRAWKLAVEVAGENPGTDSYRIGIGEAYFKQGNYSEALLHLLAGVGSFDRVETMSYPRIWEHYRDLSVSYEQLGQFEEALAYRKRAMEVRDTLVANQIENLKTEALAKYESGKKDQLLADQGETIQQQTRIQQLTVGAAIILALLLSTLFFFYRKNQKSKAELANKNQENELLLKEIHHRVKNNLEMVSSLLKLQSVKTKDAGAKEVMLASQNRVQSMGILHQKLYQGKNLGTVEMMDYFRNLGENILDAYGADEKVSIRLDMEPLELDVDTAVPIGLIVNELLTNALKYAFPDDRPGEINLSLRELENNQLQLVVADNGVGQESGTNSKGTGFGSQLIQLLTEQLQGTMRTDYNGGTILSFQLEKAHLD